MLRNSLRLVGRSFGYLPRIVLIGAMLLLFAVATVVLILRHWILPDISRYHGVITTKVSQVVGRPVSIGKIEADWRGLRPHLLFTDVRIMDAQGGTALALSSVDNIVSWMTLLTGEVRLYSLELDQPNLLIRRDMEGLLHIADVPLSRQESNQGAGADWLLHQTLIIVRNARIIWLDERRAAPALVLDQVNLHIENSGHQHRFAMRAKPPAQLSAQLDVRGNFLGKSFDKLDVWSGQLFTQIDNAHSEAWRTWLPLPPEIQRGTGAVRAWVVAEEGKVVQVTADLIAANVQAQLAEDLPALDLAALRGRVTWREKPKEFEVTTRKLSLQMRDGLTVPPTDLFLRLSSKDQPKDGAQDKFGDKGGKSADQQSASGELHTNTLDLQSVVTLANYLPIKPEWKQQLAEYSPHGLISNAQVKWQMSAKKLQHFDIKSHFDGLSVARVGKFPGFSGLSGEISGSDTSGRLALNAQKVTVDAPEIMMEALTLDTLAGELGWQSKDGGMEIKFNNVTAANEHIAGNSTGSYQTVRGSRGIIDLTVHLTHASVRHTALYIPLHLLGEQAHSWIRDALLDGQADEFRLRLQGDLKDFPFEGNRKGIFEIRAKAKEVVLEYGKAWPVVENGAAELLIQGKRLEVNVATATTMGFNLKKVSVVVPDITSPELMLEVRGEAMGDTLLALNFIRQSPVSGYLGGFTENAQANGKGHLTLQLSVPLRGSKPVTVSGNYQFFDNDLTLGGMIPPLMRTSGMLSFTESTVSTRQVTTQIFGGPATLSVQRDPSGTIKINASGSADMESLRKVMTHPVLNYLQGGSAWKTDILVQGKQVSGVFYSDLIGLSSDLPAPLFKQAETSLPLRLEKKILSAEQEPEQEMVSAQLGSVLDVKLWGTQKNESFDVKRGTVVFGKGADLPRRDGVWVSGTLPVLSLSGWEPLLGSGSATPVATPASNTQVPIRLAGIDLLIEKVGGYGYMADNLHINARNPKGLMLAQLSSEAINGELRWQPQGNGKLVARLKNLSPYKGNIKKPDEGMKGSEKNAQLDPIQKNRSTAFPALDVTIDSLILAGNNLGRFELVGEQRERDWQLERVRLTNADGVLSADGKWQMGEKEQTVLNARLDINNAGKILGRFGYPNTVRRGSGRLDGTFTWQGGPAAFSYAKLNGSLKVDTVKGQFLEIDPGFGKLLSILSLQALPRHASLDFADVFSKGFAFDNITGNGIIEGGILSTDDFKIIGSAAKVNMVGQVDLNRETQNLQVRVYPAVGNSVSLLGFVGGPAVGVGVFLANKLLRDPLDKLVSFEYNVSGSWAEPNVKKMDRN